MSQPPQPPKPDHAASQEHGASERDASDRDATEQGADRSEGQPFRLTCTPRSHYSRKVRLVAALSDVPLELVDVGNVADTQAFAHNPLMKVPVLEHAGRTVFDSDHIAAYLVRQTDPSDPLEVLTTDVEALNTRALLNGAMAAEVELVLAERGGLNTRGVARFDKLRQSIVDTLAFLDERSAVFNGPPRYVGLHLCALYDHLALYDLVPLNAPRLAAHVERLSAIEAVAASRPS